MKWVILPTDALTYLLVISIIVAAFIMKRQEDMRMAWRQVLHKRIAMCSLVILFAYVVIGLLDSIHFQIRVSSSTTSKIYYSQDVQSVLDKLIAPLGQEDEITYSAPFAIKAYTKTIITLPNGTLIRDYAPLRFAGKNLKNHNNKWNDIEQRILCGALLALGIWLVLVIPLIYFLAGQHHQSFFMQIKTIFLGKTYVRWREIVLTIAILLQIICIVSFLAAEYHVLGTDKVGGDVLYETLKSIRTGLIIGTLTTLIMLPFAVLFGMLAGFWGGWIDDSIQYVYTTLSSIPAVLLITAAILSLQIFIDNHPDIFPTLAQRADLRLLILCVLLGITSWTNLCRLIRAETLKLREMDFVAAAITLGTGNFKIVMNHILPNVMHIILITVVLDFSGLVLAEAVLSYVGVGVDPTTISWGNMINSARLELAREPAVWWPLLAAFLLMFVLVLAANLFADALRDAFNPRLRNNE